MYIYCVHNHISRLEWKDETWLKALEGREECEILNLTDSMQAYPDFLSVCAYSYLCGEQEYSGKKLYSVCAVQCDLCLIILRSCDP